MDKQLLLFEQLKDIKDYWVETGSISLEKNSDLFWSDLGDQYLILQGIIRSDQEKEAFKNVCEELIRGTIHSILVMIDGGDKLADQIIIDLIDQNTQESLKGKGALHEEFFNYLTIT